MRNASLLVYLAGAPPESVEARHGDFARWFGELASPYPLHLRVCDGPAGERPPSPRELAGIVITGSPSSLTAPEPWMEEAIALVRAGAEVGTPVLGVCFGHQVIGAAFGANVVRNPAGWEMGTHEVELTQTGRRDPLFRDMPSRFCANFSHRDIVDPATVSAGNGLQVLAHNERAGAQALAAGETVRGVQFHPEFTGEITRDYVRTRWDALEADALERSAHGDHPERLFERTLDCPQARHVFERFLEHFVSKA